MGTSDLATQVSEIVWFHTIELPGGVTTPGVNPTPKMLCRLALPESLAGKSVLDVGAWDGFYSFEAALRGATRVLATDSYVWQGDWSQRGFNLARTALGLEDVVEDRLIDVMDLSPDSVGTFDVVLFLGVLYHLRDPITAIERVSSVCREFLVVETETALNFLHRPAARLWPGAELADDDTNWWSLNESALRALLQRNSFPSPRTVYRTSTVRRLAHMATRRNRLPTARLVMHATRST
jgi:tRNA (mo5U34)-methyltransferase